MPIPLTLTVLVIIPEAAMLCCRLACIKEMVLTITVGLFLLLFSFPYCFPSGLAKKEEGGSSQTAEQPPA